MKTLEDTIKQYEQRVVIIKREADERIKEIEKHIKKLRARLVRERKQFITYNTITYKFVEEIRSLHIDYKFLMEQVEHRIPL